MNIIMQKIIITIITFAFLLTSCTKEVNLQLSSAESQIVIEGNITNEVGPYSVEIHKSVNFTQANTLPAVSGAVVTISDNTGITETLKEAVPGIYQTSTLTGVPGRTYELKVSVEGKDYNAVSTMPQPVKLDTVIFELSKTIGDSGGSEYSTLPVFTDPANTINNYRFVQTINGKRDKTYFVLNDNTFNGLKNEQQLFNPDTEIKAGDVVEIEFRCTDRSVYDYFFTLSQFSSDGPYNTTPTNPPTNIKGAFAYGIFSAHTVRRMTAVVPKN
jgi:hypothetical protein